jgi:hypothetical protein
MKGTMGDYTIPAVSESLLWMFFLILVEKKELEQLEKFNALKASKPGSCRNSRSHGI